MYRELKQSNSEHYLEFVYVHFFFQQQVKVAGAGKDRSRTVKAAGDLRWLLPHFAIDNPVPTQFHHNTKLVAQ